MSFSPESMRQALQAHATHCLDLLQIATQEGQSLRNSDYYDSKPVDYLRRNMISDLDRSLEALKVQRVDWQQLTATERARHPEISQLIRSTQEVGMKLIVVDRENEKFRLRRGLLPGGPLPTTQTQRPNFLARLYQRHGT